MHMKIKSALCIVFAVSIKKCWYRITNGSITCKKIHSVKIQNTTRVTPLIFKYNLKKNFIK